ncbi:histidine kinase [Nocardiopsis sp. N85]|uniref:sensor histidine kinase n=1 Tax=Nocardiopsis sp. N85 TaxID=3029400 RepID=UPI00237F0FA6|nr:histidine kinase [Nocardiopsis sp. N85]MDE3722534.1 histidine kinase [Nocardiopsis sp. N85]
MPLNRIVAVLGAPREGWPARALVGITAGLLLLAVVGDLLMVYDNRNATAWPGPPRGPWDLAPAISGAVGGALALTALRPRAGATAVGTAALAAALVVTATSVALWPLPKGMFGYPIAVSEAFALFLALAVVGLRCGPRWIGAVAVTAFLAASSDQLREGAGDTVTTALLMVLVGLAPGLYLRWRGHQREYHVERARSQERLAVARDLHDVVAHEVTGIVVQAQALRRISADRPETVVRALPDIEAAGIRALDSMRAMVSRLRGPDEVPLMSDVADGLARLAQAPGGPGVTVRVEAPLSELSPEIGTALLRIAQESVTNARRHARGATRVEVAVTATGERVRITVRDDGRATGGGGGGGFGLVGMAERARLLGGELTAGPAEHGWEVSALLPRRPCG